jgi:putative transposase
VHLIAVPKRADSLARGIGEAHRLYTRAKNFRAGVRGYLFQGRFGSYVMDERHLVAAARYVELDPVAANIVNEPWDYDWSSARYHTGRMRTDPIVTDRTLAGTVRDAREWRELLSDGVEDVVAKRLERSLSTGRPVGSREFVRRLERRLGRDLAPRTGGWPKGKKRKRRRN